MKNSRLFIFLVLFVSVFSLTSCTLPFIGKKKKAALQVTSTPKTTVFLNEEHVGQTPFFDENLKPGDYTLKLVPDSGEDSLLSWQGKIKLSSGILTVVNRELAKDEYQSSGYLLNLEPIAEKDKVRMSIISTPDSVVVSLDGEPKGFTPLSLDDLVEKEYVLTISSPGFKEETIKAKTVKGHKLLVNVQLAELEEDSDEEEIEENEDKEEDEGETSSEQNTDSEEKEEDEKSATSSAQTMEKPYVEIKNTPTGWLNVRSEPSTAGKTETVLTKVNPGEVYKFIEANQSGWYKIEYEEGKEGWIASRYATLHQ